MRLKSFFLGVVVGAALALFAVALFGDQLRGGVAETTKELGQSVKKAGHAIEKQGHKLH